eukprot:gene635-440_t
MASAADSKGIATGNHSFPSHHILYKFSLFGRRKARSSFGSARTRSFLGSARTEHIVSKQLVWRHNEATGLTRDSFNRCDMMAKDPEIQTALHVRGHGLPGLNFLPENYALPAVLFYGVSCPPFVVHPTGASSTSTRSLPELFASTQFGVYAPYLAGSTPHHAHPAHHPHGDPAGHPPPPPHGHAAAVGAAAAVSPHVCPEPLHPHALDTRLHAPHGNASRSASPTHPHDAVGLDAASGPTHAPATGGLAAPPTRQHVLHRFPPLSVPTCLYPYLAITLFTVYDVVALEAATAARDMSFTAQILQMFVRAHLMKHLNR